MVITAVTGLRRRASFMTRTRIRRTPSEPERDRDERVQDDERDQHADRQRRPHGPVARRDEGLLDPDAEHHAAGAAQELRRHVVGGGEHEDEHERRRRGRRHEREHDAGPPLDRAGAEVLRGLEQAGVDRPEGGVDHEHRVGQEDVDERDRDRELVVEERVEGLDRSARRSRGRC